ncbi:hypothetical protein VST7929_03132 [Vibrio stylophorae]|uniref:Uncharacterized protein n=1 Tax=Vibrio stylophorae TaxID=659351 RepID=A0ABN8DZ67_9VIBR|nr:hypothetical protein [Vibrio stylophorae]CAH0535594.1 hypothetical protein VST7929_03132 [Vibrio stylophorae]
MLKNKHVIIALLVAPILSVIAYLATDIALSEKPHAAKEGQSYKLLSKSNCRYTSGLCDMENGEFKIKFRAEKLTEDGLVLSLTSVFPLDGIKLALVDTLDAQTQPTDMQPSSQDGKHWSVQLPAPASEKSWLRVAAQADGVIYYGDTQTAFVTYQTLLSE